MAIKRTDFTGRFHRIVEVGDTVYLAGVTARNAGTDVGEQTADVLALIPEGPPRQFRWRGVLHQVAQAQGPERIGPEWWRRDSGGPERDYYAVEDESGRRFWLFRAGHTSSPC